jgi:ferric-dicitrate binding protein FerR (iron transport regulator)
VLWVTGSLAAAAAVLLFIGLGLRDGVAGEFRVEVVRGSVRARGADELKPGDLLGAGDVVRTAPDSRIALRLQDGTSLRLDTQSTARLLSAASIALLEGALYVDTGASPLRASPIEVHTPLGLVTEVGTQFDVRLSAGSLSLRVRDGQVSLSRGGRLYSAGAGRRLTVDSEGKVAAGDTARHGEEWSWTLGIAPSFDLEGRSLHDFLAWVSSETGWRVEYEEPSIAERAPTLILHGSIEGLRPDQAPAAVLPTCGLRHKVAEGAVIVGPL